MKFAFLLIVLFTLSSCDTTNEYEKNTPEISGNSTTNSAISTEITSSTERNVLQKYP